MKNILITTAPFAAKVKTPIKLLEQNGFKYRVNLFGRKLTEVELIDVIGDVEVLIAGTEPITSKVLNSAKNLKLISRVGIGLDNVDLCFARAHGIHVSYTPDAPAPAVAELTIGLIFSLIRSIHISNTTIHNKGWQRFFGRRICDIRIGIIGVGRIGGKVLKILEALGVTNVLVNDLEMISMFDCKINLIWADKDTIFREADLVTIHVPLTHQTYNMVSHRELMLMKSDAMLVNTSRGGVVNEDALIDVLGAGHLSGVALDVFCEEPYRGGLTQFDRCLLTAHMGSMSVDCRSRMELEATEEAIRFLNGMPLLREVPDFEYTIQMEAKK